MAIEYKNAGVDVEAGYKAVSLMKEHVKRTFNQRVITRIQVDSEDCSPSQGWRCGNQCWYLEPMGWARN